METDETALKRKAEAAERMQEFMRHHPPVQGVDVKALIEEGRDS